MNGTCFNAQRKLCHNQEHSSMKPDLKKDMRYRLEV